MNLKYLNPTVLDKAKNIKLLLTDNDGVLTDTGVYYSEKGEELKRYSIRDGMGVERLRNFADVETGIITGEVSGSIEKRAEKLKIQELHMGIKDKKRVLDDIIKRKALKPENIAYIGDDTNDIEILKNVGLSACPADAVINIKQLVHVICASDGGYGAFRDFAEIIICAKVKDKS